MKRRGFFASLFALPAAVTGARAAPEAPAAPKVELPPLRRAPVLPPGDNVFNINVLYGDEESISKSVARAVDAYNRKNPGGRNG